MYWKAGRDRAQGYAVFRVAVVLLIIAIVAGCATAPRTASHTPTAQPTIAQLTPSPAWTTAPGATTTPGATATPIPTTTPSTACIPPRGVRPVSPLVIYSGNRSKMQVSLTFDSDGGKGDTAVRYLNILSARHVHATFFLTGVFARAHPDIVRRILAEGHDLGNHTMDHADLTKLPRTDTFVCTELRQAEQLIVAASGHTPRPFFRPPDGSFNKQVRTLAASLGYRTVYWSVDPRDWERTVTAQGIVSRVLGSRTLKPGAIILMHIDSLNEQYALDSVITGLEQRGYTIVPLSQLLQ